MESTQGQPVEERMHAAGSVEERGRLWYQPKRDTEGDHLDKAFENIAMNGDGDRKLFFAEEKLDIFRVRYPHVGQDREVVRLFTRRLPSRMYDISRGPVSFSPISRSRKRNTSFVPPTLTARPRRWKSGS